MIISDESEESYFTYMPPQQQNEGRKREAKRAKEIESDTYRIVPIQGNTKKIILRCVAGGHDNIVTMRTAKIRIQGEYPCKECLRDSKRKEKQVRQTYLQSEQQRLFEEAKQWYTQSAESTPAVVYTLKQQLESLILTQDSWSIIYLVYYADSE